MDPKVIIVGFVLVMMIGSGVIADKQETQISIQVIPDNPPEGFSFVLTGGLTDADGLPLGNKRIILESSPDGDPAYPFEEVAITNTDRSGNYTFFRGNLSPPEYLRASFKGNAGYNPVSSTVVPIHMVGINQSTVVQSRSTGGLMVSGEPDDAFVILDGEVRGVSPLVVNGIESGPHILDIGKPGYHNQTMEVFIAPERQISFSFSLTPSWLTRENTGFETATGLHVFKNSSFFPEDTTPAGDPVYSFNKAGVSVDIYGNNSSSNSSMQQQITTLYDEHPFGDGFSLSVIVTSDDTPFR